MQAFLTVKHTVFRAWLVCMCFFQVLWLGAQTSELQVTFISNEGFLLRSGDQSVLIDALYRKSHPDYTFPSDATLNAMIRGRKPFKKVDIYLQSHVHYTHFFPETVGQFLNANKQARMIASPQVVDSLQKLYGGYEKIAGQLMLYDWEDEHKTFSYDGIDIETFKITHDGRQWSWVQNLGHLIHLNGHRVLHMGDLVLDEQVLSNMNLASKSIDLVILPFWVVLRPGGVNKVKRLINARHYIVSHYPIPNMAANIKRVKNVFPEALILNTPLKSMSF